MYAQGHKAAEGIEIGAQCTRRMASAHFPAGCTVRCIKPDRVLRQLGAWAYLAPGRGLSPAPVDALVGYVVGLEATLSDGRDRARGGPAGRHGSRHSHCNKREQCSLGVKVSAAWQSWSVGLKLERDC